MGAFDGAEIADLVGLLLLSKINKQFPKLDFGLYRDDGLAVYKSMRGIHVDKMRKDLHKLFAEHELKITADFRCHRVDFLDVTFDIQEDTYKPFRKPNDTPSYIHKHSNHPPHILQQIPRMVEKRLVSISSSKSKFDEATTPYNQALKKSGYNTVLNFDSNRQVRQNEANTQNQRQDQSHETSPKTFLNSTQDLTDETRPKTCYNTTQDDERRPTTSQKKKRKNRRRRTFWYNPPFNKAVATNIGKRFLSLIDNILDMKEKISFINYSTDIL